MRILAMVATLLVSAGPSQAAPAAVSFVEIGPMSPAVRSAVDSALRRHAPTLRTRAPAGPATGYYLEATLTSLAVDGGAAAQVSCRLTMVLATWPGRSMFGFLRGSASVPVGGVTDETTVARWGDTCIQAAVDDLVARQLGPTIERRTSRLADRDASRCARRRRSHDHEDKDGVCDDPGARARRDRLREDQGHHHDGDQDGVHVEVGRR